MIPRARQAPAILRKKPAPRPASSSRGLMLFSSPAIAPVWRSGCQPSRWCWGRATLRRRGGRTGTGDRELDAVTDKTLEPRLDRVLARATKPRGAAVVIATVSTL